MVNFEVYYNVLANEETSPYDYYSFNDSGKHLGNFSEYGSCNRIIEAEIKLKEIKNRSPDKWILGHLNIYSSKNKFDSLTKLDDSFPSAMGSVLRFDGFRAAFSFNR